MTKSGVHVDAVLLAAGSSARFGSDKRIFLIDGVPMLQRALITIVDFVSSVLVVLKQDDKQSLNQLLGSFSNDKRVSVLFLDNPEAGIGSNLAQAVTQLNASSDGVLVMLGDMPFVHVDTAQAIVSAACRNIRKIVVPVFMDGQGIERRGHPVFFSSEFFPDLARLTGDIGARSVLERHSQSVITMSVHDRGILQDLDEKPV